MALLAAPAAAQRDSVRVRVVSGYQSEMERLTRQLLNERRLEAAIARMLGELELSMSAPGADSMRGQVTAQSRLLSEKLRASTTTQFKLRRDLEQLCSSVRKPQGWLGIATTGVTVFDRQGDGPQVVRYLERPIVASVDPGSPADRAGLRSGDMLIEIGGQVLLHQDVVFAELLRPGEKITVKTCAAGGHDLQPLVEPMPGAEPTPCSGWMPVPRTCLRRRPRRVVSIAC